MITDEQLARIETAALAAVGLPEMRCQVAMANIYKAAGLLPADMDVPEGNRGHAAAEGVSLISPFMESCPLFEEVTGPAMPGDLLGFRLGRVLHHVAILLSGGRMAHVFGVHGVQIAVVIPDSWAKRLEKTWRIKT